MSVKEKVEEKVEEKPLTEEKPEPALLTCRELEQVIDRRVRRVLCQAVTDVCVFLLIFGCICMIFED